MHRSVRPWARLARGAGSTPRRRSPSFRSAARNRPAPQRRATRSAALAGNGFDRPTPLLPTAGDSVRDRRIDDPAPFHVRAIAVPARTVQQLPPARQRCRSNRNGDPTGIGEQQRRAAAPPLRTRRQGRSALPAEFVKIATRSLPRTRPDRRVQSECHGSSRPSPCSVSSIASAVIVLLPAPDTRARPINRSPCDGGFRYSRANRQKDLRGHVSAGGGCRQQAKLQSGIEKDRMQQMLAGRPAHILGRSTRACATPSDQFDRTQTAKSRPEFDTQRLKRP